MSNWREVKTQAVPVTLTMEELHLVIFCVRHMADYRGSRGDEDVADRYNRLAEMLRDQERHYEARLGFAKDSK